jgi:hypothetical protein
MPYIKHERRAALNVIIDSLVKAVREERLQFNIVRYIAYSLSAFCMGFPTLSYTESLFPTNSKIVELMYGLMDRLQEIGCTRGDVNYTLTRIVLESLKPETSKECLSDAWSEQQIKLKLFPHQREMADDYLHQFVLSDSMPLEQVSGCMADAIEKDREEIRKLEDTTEEVK